MFDLVTTTGKEDRVFFEVVNAHGFIINNEQAFLVLGVYVHRLNLPRSILL